MTEPKLSIENKLIDIPDLNRFRIGDHVIAEATFDHDRHEGVIIGIELVRAYGSISLTLQPSITLLHDGDQIADGFFPDHLTKVHSDPSPGSHVMGVDADLLKALKYVRRFLNPEDHDVSYVDDVIDKAEGRGLYADRNLRGVCPTCEGTGKEGRHSICRDCDEPVSEKMEVK